MLISLTPLSGAAAFIDNYLCREKPAGNAGRELGHKTSAIHVLYDDFMKYPGQAAL